MQLSFTQNEQTDMDRRLNMLQARQNPSINTPVHEHCSACIRCVMIFRNLSGNLQQQLCVAKEQISVLKVQQTQLQMQVDTLQQGKDVLHGEKFYLHFI